MAKEYWSPGTGEGGGTQFETRRNSRDRPWWASGVLALVILGLQAACASGYPMGGTLAGTARHWGSAQRVSPGEEERVDGALVVAVARPNAPSEDVEVADVGAEDREGTGVEEVSAAESDKAARRPRYLSSRVSRVEEEEVLEREGVGWPDGVGDGRPFEVPMSLDYFQGFLVQAGVPSTAVPRDGRTLSPQQALELVPYLLATPVTLGSFGPRRMAAHVLMEVATGGELVTRDELHARMRRFSRLLVLRPDGYLVKVTSGEAVQKAGQVVLAEDGTLRAGRFEVGPFYAIDGERLFPVDEKLEVPKGARPTGIYEPDDNPGLAVAEGAVLAMVDMVEGLYRLVFYTGETLEGLAQLPGAVRQLYESSPQLWEEFRHKPHAEKVRTVSRLVTGMVLTVGTSGAGAAKAASWGGKLGSVAVPLLSLSGEGLLAVRLVAVPVGGAVAVAGNALSATYVLHMANTSAQGAGGGGGWPPVGGPGQWVEDTSSMSEQARDYQAQVTGAPKRWAYKVCRDGECVNYDGYEPKTGTLLEAKAREYAKWFDEKLDPRFNYEGLEDMVAQAERQLRVAGGRPLRWHVAEPRMVAVLRKWFDLNDLQAVEVVYTQPIR
ncbi:restriction endonuclease fold toxin 5 domain-containing protein [Archangium lipolyticum]|uniref:restriction endonuclease fold toxin 5 domain-containing protein n=1 Tax=Archangium lipolyticum TaxID=2970465 RepID=UPI00214A3FB6|nr:restriction endonuclease fold toxin 5 domain-containing protein [Archangium lipolyticum]